MLRLCLHLCALYRGGARGGLAATPGVLRRGIQRRDGDRMCGPRALPPPPEDHEGCLH